MIAFRSRPTLTFLGDIVSTQIVNGAADQAALRTAYRAGGANGSRNGSEEAPKESVVAAVSAAGSALAHATETRADQLRQELDTRHADLEELERTLAELESELDEAERRASKREHEVTEQKEIDVRGADDASFDRSASSDVLNAQAEAVRRKRAAAKAAADHARRLQEATDRHLEAEGKAADSREHLEEAKRNRAAIKHELAELESELDGLPALTSASWDRIRSVGDALWAHYAAGYNERWRWWWRRSAVQVISPNIKFDPPAELSRLIHTSTTERQAA